MKASINKVKYRSFLEAVTPILFNSASWLDAVSESWDAVIVEDVNGEIIAGLPFQYKSKWGIKSINMPPLTPYFDILIKDSYKSNALKIHDLLIKTLPKVHYYSLMLSPNNQNVIAWKLNGFDLTNRYTFYEEEIGKYKSSLDADLRAATELSIIPYDDISTHYQLVRQIFENQNLQVPFTLSSLKNLVNTQKENFLLLKAVDKNENIQGSLLLFFDEKFCFNLSSAKIKNPHRGAIAMLTDYAIRWSVLNRKMFDFEGSNLPSIYSFYQSFSPTLMTYYRVNKTSNKLIYFIAKYLSKF